MTGRPIALALLVGVTAGLAGCGESPSDVTTAGADAPPASSVARDSTTTSTTAPGTTASPSTAAPGTTSSTAVAPVSLEIEGVVIAFDGDLTDARWFTIRTSDGADVEFSIADDATFDGGNIGHLRDHLLSGAPVVVTYHESDGVLVATFTADAH